MILTGSAVWAETAHFAVTPQEIVAKLKPELKLSGQQSKEMTSALTDLSNTLYGLVEKQKAAGQGDDPSAFINGVKDAQRDYQAKLKTILDADQLKTYGELREKVIMQAMDSIAEIKLYDIQPHVKFSDTQLEKLVPVLGESLRGFLKIAWQYAGERLGFLRKLRIVADLKQIQSKAQQQMQTILTPEQYKAWEAYKQAQQQKEEAAEGR